MNLDVFTLFPEHFEWFVHQRHLSNALAAGNALSFHNYRDTNKRKGQVLGGTKRLLKAVRGDIWLTETGGIVKFRLPNGHLLFPYSESRANTATKRMFALAKRYRSRIKRLYIYHWKQPAASNRFDAGLIGRDGKARPAYNTVLNQLATGTFNP